jgi:hypothetical protein
MKADSTVWECACGHMHILAGPASCWVCCDWLDAAQWACRVKGYDWPRCQLHQDLWAMKYASLMRNMEPDLRGRPEIDPEALGWPDWPGFSFTG